MRKSFGTFKARKTGNSLTVTIPKKTGVQVGDEFELHMEDNKLIYTAVTSKSENPWLKGSFDDYDFRSDLDEIDNVGNEKSVGKENI